MAGETTATWAITAFLLTAGGYVSAKKPELLGKSMESPFYQVRGVERRPLMATAIHAGPELGDEVSEIIAVDE